MIKDIALEILNLIKDNEGLNKYELYTKPNIQVQKIIELILGESKCSIIDNSGNYTRLGSSIDIRIIKNIIKIYISNAKEIPPEIVSMALTKEEILGPFMKLDIQKIYDNQYNKYEIKLQKIFPDDFNLNIFKENIQVRTEFIDNIITPYVKNIIFENDILMSKSPIGAFIGKKMWVKKENEELVYDLVSILKKVCKCDEKINEELIQNISNYIVINIMNNKSFKSELINGTLNATELQKLGKIYTGFNGLVENMVSQTIKMLELKDIPFEEYKTIENTFYIVISVLKALSTSFDNLSENQILDEIEKVNLDFSNIGKFGNQGKYEHIGEKVNIGKCGNENNDEYSVIGECSNINQYSNISESSDIGEYSNISKSRNIEECSNLNEMYNGIKKMQIYRTGELHMDEYGNIMEFVKPELIPTAMNNLCKMIKILLKNKEQIGIEMYLREVIRIHYRLIRIQPFTESNGKTARAIANILLQSKGMIGVFRKEKKKDYVQSIVEASKVIKDNETQYIDGLSCNPMWCMQVENEFLNKELPFMLVRF